MAENVNYAQKWIVEELTSIISLNNDLDDDNINNVDEPPAKLSLTGPSNSLRDHFDRIVSEVRNVICPNVFATLMIINNYHIYFCQLLELPHFSREKSLDLWKRHKIMFSELYKLQLKYLCITATLVPSERVISKEIIN